RAAEAAPAVVGTRVRVDQGTYRLVAVSAARPVAEEAPREDPKIAVDWIAAEGPLSPPRQDLPESHRRIIPSDPPPAERSDCARRILERLVLRAFRRPPLAGEVDRLTRFVEKALEDGESFARGIQVALTAILVSPHFLFRVEIDPPAE